LKSNQTPGSRRSKARAQAKKNPPKPAHSKPVAKGESKEPRRAPRPLNFRMAFAELWHRLFTSPVHLDSALSKAPPSQKSALAEISRLLLQRPVSLAKFLKFYLSEEEPFGLDKESLAEWPTARAMADRLFQAWKRDPNFAEEGWAAPGDYPIWMIDEWRRDFGDKVAKELVETLAKPAPLSLRASRKFGRNELVSALNDSAELSQRAKTSKVSPFGFIFPTYEAVLGHPLFKQGAYEIQDEGSQIMALFALWPKDFLPMVRKVPGACREWPANKEVPKHSGNITVIDACAGAGGKTLAMSDALLGKGQVFAYDVSAKKLEALKKRATRMQLHNIKTLSLTEGSEEQALKKFHQSADRVLVDAPCSGWGTLRRNPDAKWRQEYDSLERLESLQARILDLYAPLVKVGGSLAYGVCTFRKGETEEQVQRFLDRHPEYRSIGGGYFGPNPSDAFYLYAFERIK
jgi:16S rRNA C967 or C1407 C5-methylase (RsmB/RsmF family)